MNSAKNSIKKARQQIRQNISKHTILLLILIVGSFSILALYDLKAETNTNLILQNNTELNYTEGNQLGTLIVRDNSIFLRTYDHPQYQACIYTTNNEPPIITEVQTKTSDLSDNTKRIDLTIDIPTEELSERNFEQTLSVEQEEKCTITSEPKITIREATKNNTNQSS